MGERQAKVNEKRQYFKGWETLVNYLLILIRERYPSFFSLILCIFVIV